MSSKSYARSSSLFVHREGPRRRTSRCTRRRPRYGYPELNVSSAAAAGELGRSATTTMSTRRGKHLCSVQVTDVSSAEDDVWLDHRAKAALLARIGVPCVVLHTSFSLLRHTKRISL